MKILITGGCGFVGSNLAIKIKIEYPSFEVICFDNLKRRGSELNLPRLKFYNIQFVHGDIRIPTDFKDVGSIDLLIEAAAEPSVLAGLDGGTEYLTDTNLNGTINCLNFALKNKADFIFLSTSRVYPIESIEAAKWIEEESRFSWTDQTYIEGITKLGISEKLRLDGYRSLYGTTKLASELIIQEYSQMFGMKAIINRCGVITGPFQMGKIDQGVIVLWAAKHYWNKTLSYLGYGGKGKQVRDILHIDDLFNLIKFQINNFDKLKGEILNVGGGLDCSLSLMELTMLCQKYSDNTIKINGIKENRSSDLRIYITDNSKVTILTGWKPMKTPEMIMEEIFSWIRENEIILKPILA